MIIRSQDKKTIINFQSIAQIYVDDNFSQNKSTVCLDFPDGRTTKLGEYKTSKEAIKVLDDISNGFFVYQMP